MNYIYAIWERLGDDERKEYERLGELSAEAHELYELLESSGADSALVNKARERYERRALRQGEFEWEQYGRRIGAKPTVLRG